MIVDDSENSDIDQDYVQFQEEQLPESESDSHSQSHGHGDASASKSTNVQPLGLERIHQVKNTIRIAIQGGEYDMYREYTFSQRLN